MPYCNVPLVHTEQQFNQVTCICRSYTQFQWPIFLPSLPPSLSPSFSPSSPPIKTTDVSSKLLAGIRSTHLKSNLQSRAMKSPGTTMSPRPSMPKLLAIRIPFSGRSMGNITTHKKIYIQTRIYCLRMLLVLQKRNLFINIYVHDIYTVKNAYWD